MTLKEEHGLKVFENIVLKYSTEIMNFQLKLYNSTKRKELARI